MLRTIILPLQPRHKRFIVEAVHIVGVVVFLALLSSLLHRSTQRGDVKTLFFTVYFSKKETTFHLELYDRIISRQYDAVVAV